MSVACCSVGGVECGLSLVGCDAVMQIKRESQKKTQDRTAATAMLYSVADRRAAEEQQQSSSEGLVKQGQS